MRNLHAAAVFPVVLILVSSVKGEFDCCNQVEIWSSGLAGDHQGNRLGRYDLYDVQDQRPIYKQQDKLEYLFYLVSNKKGLWMVGPSVGQFNGGLAHRGDNICVQNVRPGQWKFTDGAAWHRDPQMNITCVDQVVDCLYKDGWELEGSDLPSSLGGGGLATASSAECIQQCQQRNSCLYWTFSKHNTTNCFLKTSNAKLVERSGYLSGSIPAACATTNERTTEPISQESTTEHGRSIDHQNKKYNENEINGKFKITSLKWNNKLNDKNSRTFRDLATNIEDSLMDMFKREQELNEKLNFTVSVEKFKKGSVVCNFKVNYVLREAYVAIPFIIKPSNITNTLMKNFKFKKGILFQRFLIAAGSFNATSPVDHCASKGCSHKCNYDYDIEDYICTCPRSLALNINQLTCVTKDKQNDNLDKQTNQTETTTANTDSQEDTNVGSELDTKEKDEDIEINTEVNAVEETTELNEKDQNTIDEQNNEANTENNEEENTEKNTELNAEDLTSPSPIVLTLLATDCLWSPWSVWAACSGSCGAGQTYRTRDVLMEERNGGACPGDDRQTFECQLDKCTESDTENISTQGLDEEIITQELDEEFITQELDENDVTTSTTNTDDDDNFPDEGEIQFGEKLPKESTDGENMEDLDSTTIDIHEYDTTTPSQYDTTTPSQYDTTTPSQIQEEQFRKEEDELIIFDPLETTTTGNIEITTEDISHVAHNSHNDHDDNEDNEHDDNEDNEHDDNEDNDHDDNEDNEHDDNEDNEHDDTEDDEHDDNEDDEVPVTVTYGIEDTTSNIDDESNQTSKEKDDSTDEILDSTTPTNINHEITGNDDTNIHFPEDEEMTTSNNNDGKETSTSTILEDDNDIYEDEDNENQQSETTEPPIDALVVTVSSNDIHFDSTDLPTLNQIAGINDDNEETFTVNTDTTEAIPINDYPTTSESSQDFPETSESSQDFPETSESSQDNQETSESSQDNQETSESSPDFPQTSESSQDFPVTSESSKDTQIISKSSQDFPETSESSQDTTKTSDSSQDFPITSESSQDFPVTSESSTDSPITSESSQDFPVTSESSQDFPLTSESSQDFPVTSESSTDSPITSESSQDFPVTSESSKDFPVTSESSKDNQIISKSSQDFPETSESSQDTTKPSDSNQDFPITSESSQDFPVTSESSQDESSTEYPITSEQSDDNLINSEENKNDPMTSESSTKDPFTSESSTNDPLITKESGFTTILIPKKQITTTPTPKYEGSGTTTETDESDENQITTIQNYFEGEEDNTTTRTLTVIEETTTIPNDGHFRFKCSELDNVEFEIADNQLPMNCTLENTGNQKEKNKHVIIIISKDSFDSTRLFDDNVKLVATNVMLMDISK